MSRILWILAVLLQSLAAASDAARHPADRPDFGDRAVERRAGAEPAGSQQLRPRGRHFRRRQNGSPGRPQRRPLPAATLRRPAPRRLAGVSGSRGPHPDRRQDIPAARYRACHAAGRSRQCAGDRKSRLAILRHAAGRNAGVARDAFRAWPAGRRLAAGERQHLAAAASRGGATRAGRHGGRYRHCPAASQNARSGLAAPDRQDQRPSHPARKCRR